IARRNRIFLNSKAREYAVWNCSKLVPGVGRNKSFWVFFCRALVIGEVTFLKLKIIFVRITSDDPPELLHLADKANARSDAHWDTFLVPNLLGSDRGH